MNSNDEQDKQFCDYKKRELIDLYLAKLAEIEEFETEIASLKRELAKQKQISQRLTEQLEETTQALTGSHRIEHLASEVASMRGMMQEELGTRRNELETECANLRRQLAQRTEIIGRAGSIAEATVALSGIFERAQATADSYLSNVRRIQQQAGNLEAEAREHAQEIIRDAETKANRLLGGYPTAETLSEAREDSIATINRILQMIGGMQVREADGQATED